MLDPLPTTLRYEGCICEEESVELGCARCGIHRREHGMRSGGYWAYAAPSFNEIVWRSHPHAWEQPEPELILRRTWYRRQRRLETRKATR